MPNFKYIKREWKKGKWVYTYPYKGVGQKKSGLIDKVKDKIGLDEKEKYQESKKRLDTAAKHISNIKNDKTNYPHKQETLDASIRKWQDAGKQYVEAKKEYKNTPVGKLDSAKTYIENGMKKVEKLANTAVSDIQNKRAEEKEKKQREIENNNRSTSELNRKIVDYKRSQEKERTELREPELEEALDDLELYNPVPELPLKEDATTWDEDMAAVNENYDPENPATSENCVYCTVAYDMRRRGYDVEATEMLSIDSTFSILDYYEAEPNLGQTLDEWKMSRINIMYYAHDPSVAETDCDKAVQNLIDSIENEGEGARGNMSFNWFMGGGHSIVWEVENGKAVFRDCQLNKTINIMDYAERSECFMYTRFDDLTPKRGMIALVNPVD